MLPYDTSLNVGLDSGPQLSLESSGALSARALGFPPQMRAQGAVDVAERLPFGSARFYLQVNTANSYQNPDLSRNIA